MSEGNKEVSVRKSKNKDGSESVTYRKEWTENGLTYTKEVKQVDGGYIIRESKWGKPSDSEEDYIDEHKESISTENPFKKKKEEESDEQNMFDFIDNPTF